MKTKRITLAGKLVIFVILLAVVLGGTYLAGGFNFLKGDNGSNKVTEQKAVTSNDTNTSSNTNTSSTSSNDVINIALSEKITWKPIIDANGGLTTQPGSIYDKLGIKVNITLDNKPESSSTNFINNKVNSLGYTVNGYAAFYKQFQDAKVDTVMPYVTSYSSGTDGVIAKSNINSVNDFIGKKIGVPDSSSDQTLVLWLMLKSDLNQEQINQIKKNIIVYPSVKDASEAFFKGDVDVVGTRQPYLNQAKSTNGTKILFSTKSAQNLIVDGIIFRKDFADKNPEVISKFINGALQAVNTDKFDGLRQFPSFKDTTDADFKQMMTEIKYADYTVNHNQLNGLAQNLFSDMSQVWQMAGKSTVDGVANKAITDTYLKTLSDKYKLVDEQATQITNSQKQKASEQNNDQALLKKSTTINFQPNSAKFVNEADAKKSLDDFVQIAKFLDGAIIQIEGNIAGTDNSEAGKQLSLQRAKTVADYLKTQGIDPSRFVVVGNGTSKQIASNATEDGMKKNRRTDIVFKIIE